MFRGTLYFAQFGCTDHFPQQQATLFPVHRLGGDREDEDQPAPSSCPRGRLCPYSHDEAVALLASSMPKEAAAETAAAATTMAVPPPPPPTTAAPVSAIGPPQPQLPSQPPPLGHPAPAPSSMDLAAALAQALAGAGGILPYQSLSGTAPPPLSAATSFSYPASAYQPQQQQQQPFLSSTSSSSSAPVSGYQGRPATSTSAGAYNPHASLVATLTAMSSRLSAPAPVDSSSFPADGPTPPPAKKPLLLGRRREGVRGLSALRGTGAKSSLPSTSIALPKKASSARPAPKHLVAAKPSASGTTAIKGPASSIQAKPSNAVPPQAGDKRKLPLARTASAPAQPRTTPQALPASAAASTKRARIEPSDDFDPLLAFDDSLPLDLGSDALDEMQEETTKAVPPPKAPLIKRTVPGLKGTTTRTAVGLQRQVAAGSMGQPRPSAAATSATNQTLMSFRKTRSAEPIDQPAERALEVKGARLKLAVEKHQRMMAKRQGSTATPTPNAPATASSAALSVPPRPSGGGGGPIYAPVLPSTLSAGYSGTLPSVAAPSSLPYAFSTSSATSSFSSSSAPTLPTPTSSLALSRPPPGRSSALSTSGNNRLAKIRKEMNVLTRPASSGPARTPSTSVATTSTVPLVPKPRSTGIGPSATSVIAQRQLAEKQRMLDQRKKHLEDKQRQREEAEKRRHESAAHAARQEAFLGLGTAQPTKSDADTQLLFDDDDEDVEEVEYRELQGKPRDILPAPRYPTVAFDLKPKVPRAVRQAVLDKFLEETLRRHHFLHFALGHGEGKADDAWMQAAIDDATRLEAEQYQKCQSKGVYVNLCAKAMQALKKGE